MPAPDQLERPAPYRCPVCLLYRHSREPVIRAEIAKTHGGGAAEAHFQRFMAGFHERHTAARPSPTLGQITALMALVADALKDDESAADIEPPVYGFCTACRSVEVALVEVTGTRDFSGMGESAEYPTGYGCEACS